MEFLNLMKLDLTQSEVVGYYERKLNFSIGSENAPCGRFTVRKKHPLLALPSNAVPKSACF